MQSRFRIQELNRIEDSKSELIIMEDKILKDS